MRTAPLWIAAALGCRAAASAQEAKERPPPVEVPTSTQASGAPPIGDADNAYGLRVGNEEIGLYDTGSIRGFALDAGANYRLDGAFFTAFTERAERVEASAAIRAGPNLFAARFPSPTGVVDIGTDDEVTPRRNLILRGDGFGSVEAVGRLALPVTGGTVWAVGELARLDNWHGGHDAFSYGALGGTVERQWDQPHSPARISLAIIGRDQHSDLANADDITLGPARINDRLSPPDPGAPSGIAATDLIREGRLDASASYPLGRWLLVSGSVQRVHYTKGYTPAGEAMPQRTDREWAGHLAATVAVAERLSFYGAWVTGLEESGSAPAIAANANETLPAPLASQREVGAKWKVTPDATLLVSAFDITKGAPGFDGAGRWVLNGTRRHRGIEASLVAPVGPVQVVAGPLYLDAAIREAGGLRAEVVGQPRWRGSVNAQWQATARLAVDAGAYILGDAPARRDSTTTIPARADRLLGITWALGSTEVAPTLRIAGSNLLDNRGWDANDDESLTPIESRAVRASLAFAW
jgi:hypothetical protein